MAACRGNIATGAAGSCALDEPFLSATLKRGDVVALRGRDEALGEEDRGFCCLLRHCGLLFVWREDGLVVFCSRGPAYNSFIISCHSATALGREIFVGELVETNA
jgi:hypothetical protein